VSVEVRDYDADGKVDQLLLPEEDEDFRREKVSTKSADGAVFQEFYERTGIEKVEGEPPFLELPGAVQGIVHSSRGSQDALTISM
jgi:hypothetical protein